MAGMKSGLAGLGMALGLALAAAQPVAGRAPVTAETLVDRAQIEDLITRYYYNLGHSTPGSFSQFYAEDAEMVLGATTFKGREAIEGLYASTGDTPQRRAFYFNITTSNILITVDGDTATARLIYTEIIADEEGDEPRVLTQGREYDHFVKENGEWRFKRRQIVGGDEVPEDWAD